MACFAFPTTVTFVIIVFEMAGYAGAIHLIIKRIFTVAVFADQLSVTSFKLEFHVATVIETRIVPGDRTMAVATFIVASAIVHIVILVTGIAVSRRIQISRIFMAIQAGGFEMNADQWKIRRVVVEFGFLPIGRDVTFDAGCTKAFLVHVILEMTVNAGTGRIAMFVRRIVAVDAQRFKMFADEFKIGKNVIKRLFIQTDYVGITALMIGVAGCAFSRADVVRYAMKS
jgi:hypothetical protein